jgi:hypothetical protein
MSISAEKSISPRRHGKHGDIERFNLKNSVSSVAPWFRKTFSKE